ncbi:glycosyltransferase family 4 protein [Thermococcus sp.]
MRKIENLLVISNHYLTFVKDSVRELSKEIQYINVLVRINPLSEVARYLRLPYFEYVRRFSKKNLIDLRDNPSNANVHPIPVLYFLPDSRNYRLGEKLYWKFKDFIIENDIDFDLIHAHFIWPSGYAAARLAREFNVPLVITAHGYDVYDLPFRGKGWFERVRFALDSADHVITVSQSNFEILTGKLGVPVEKVSVIPNGFDSRLFYPMDKFEVREKLGLPLDKKVILNVANLVPVKGHEFLVRAMVDVLKVRRDVLLVVVGDGPLRGKLEGLVKKLGLGEYVKFVGAKPHGEVPLWMNAADLFVLSSLREGNPTVMFEALGVGLPFVGTSVGGVPEVIKSEDYGLLCPPANAKCLAEKILIALEKDWDREKIIKHAQQFTWDKIAKGIIKIYKEVLNK